ncbi:MAG: cysteine synthase A [Clostridia bacterium]|nr:cysteine synthase A [Clostridia bacterium]
MRIYNEITDLIGKTPLVEIKRFAAVNDLSARLLVKLESFNPAGSAKDRVALAMITDAEERGLLRQGGTVIEPTSGNTGIGLALVALVRGYRVILTMPDTMSMERRNLLKAYGAELVLTDGAKGMSGAIEKARELAAEIEGAFIPDQFGNDANTAAHFATTGPEIWEDTDGEVDILVAGVGTGGTLTGAGSYLKERNPDIKVVAVEPMESAVLSGNASAPHGIQGIGAGFIPAIVDTELFDEIIPVSTKDAYSAARQLAKTEGILAGISSGAALCAAVQLAKRAENEGKMIVAVLPDSGERYLSTGVFAD